MTTWIKLFVPFGLIACRTALRPICRITLLSAFVFNATRCASAEEVRLDVKLSPEIEHLLSLPEDQIDITTAALVFAKEVYPDINPEIYNAKIDALAAQVKLMANGTRDPETRIRVMNTVLFRLGGYHYDRQQFSRLKQEYGYLNGILDTKQGVCYTMPLLYVAVAQRAGYPIYPVLVPDHMFVRYRDPSFHQQNIETTSGGKYIEDEWYIHDFAIGKKGLESGSYMKTLTYHEFLAQMVAVNASFWGPKNGQKGIAYIARAHYIMPRFADYSEALRIGFADMAKVESSPEKQEKYRKMSSYYGERAEALGYVGLRDIQTERDRIRGK